MKTATAVRRRLRVRLYEDREGRLYMWRTDGVGYTGFNGHELPDSFRTMGRDFLFDETGGWHLEKLPENWRPGRSLRLLASLRDAGVGVAVYIIQPPGPSGREFIGEAFVAAWESGRYQ